jgi:hypothetical protein
MLTSGAHHPQPPRVAVLGQFGGQVLDDRQQRIELGGRPLQVVGGQQVERDVADAGRVAPAEQLLDPGRADPVAVVRVDVPHLTRPPAIAVTHDADMPRHRLAGQLAGEASLVERIDQGPQSHRVKPIERARRLKG